MFFRDAGFDIDMICGNSNYTPASDDQPADIEKIVSTNSPQVANCSTQFSDFIADSSSRSISNSTQSRPMSGDKPDKNPTKLSNHGNSSDVRSLNTPTTVKHEEECSSISLASNANPKPHQTSPDAPNPPHHQFDRVHQPTHSQSPGLWQQEPSVGRPGNFQVDGSHTTSLTGDISVNALMSTYEQPHMSQAQFASSTTIMAPQILADDINFWWDQSYESLEPNAQLVDPQLYYHISFPYDPYSFS